MTRKVLDLENRIEALSVIVARGLEAERSSALGEALGDGNSFLVAKAAAWAAETLSYELIPRMVDAYARFLDNPLKRDRTCAAKRALARALYELDHDDPKFYRSGLKYRQLEPVWGGHTDTAVEIRCTCALGLLAFGGPRALVELIDTLHDPEPRVRSGVLKALEMAQPHEAELVLRHTILQGDSEPEVIAQAFATLMKVAPETSFEFVAEYLNHESEAMREGAALALGESRLEEALEVLVAASRERSETDEFQRPLLEAIALQRHQSGYDYLLTVIRETSSTMARAAIAALSIYSHNEELRRAVQNAMESRHNPQLKKAFDEYWRGET